MAPCRATWSAPRESERRTVLRSYLQLRQAARNKLLAPRGVHRPAAYTTARRNSGKCNHTRRGRENRRVDDTHSDNSQRSLRSSIWLKRLTSDLGTWIDSFLSTIALPPAERTSAHRKDRQVLATFLFARRNILTFVYPCQTTSHAFDASGDGSRCHQSKGTTFNRWRKPDRRLRHPHGN